MSGTTVQCLLLQLQPLSNRVHLVILCTINQNEKPRAAEGTSCLEIRGDMSRLYVLTLRHKGNKHTGTDERFYKLLVT